MDLRQTLLGIVIFVVFWAYQAGYANSLGTGAWFLGAVIFVVLLMAMGKVVMPKPPEDLKLLWNFSILFALVSTFIISFMGPYIGAVFPPNFNPSQLTPLVLSFWLIVFGGTMFIGGWQAKEGLGSLIGVIWLFSSMHFVTAVGTGPNSYIHFALIAGLPFILAGVLRK